MSWATIALPTSTWIDDSKLSSFMDHFDDGVLDVATAQGTEADHLYSRTLGNGSLIEQATYAKFQQNDPGVAGYSRLVWTEELDMQNPKIVESWVMKHLGKAAVGFSTERTVGNTAYKGDVALVFNDTQIRLFYRENRAAISYEVVLLDYIFQDGDRIHVKMGQYADETRYTVEVNGVVILDDTYTTYEYTTLYALVGAYAPAGTEVGYVWIDLMRIYGDLDPGWAVAVRPDSSWNVDSVSSSTWIVPSVPSTAWTEVA